LPNRTESYFAGQNEPALAPTNSNSIVQAEAEIVFFGTLKGDPLLPYRDVMPC